MQTTIFTIIIVTLVANYLLECVLDGLNSRWRGHQPPAQLQDLYDPEKYRQQQNYQRVTTRFSFVNSTFSLALLLIFLFLDGFSWLHSIVVQISPSGITQALLFFVLLWLTNDLFSIPFELYQTFVIEQRFGFNTMNVKTFIGDKIKGWLLTVVVGGAILACVAWFYYQTKELFWFYSWLTVSGLSLFFTLFYSNLIVPLFNKQTKLEEGELKSAIEDFARKVKFPVQEIYVLDGSKRSTKANAYFTGFGRNKRIVLFDTLINDLTTNELVAVLAHEIGHYKHRHTLQGIVLSILQTGFIFYLLSLFLNYAVFSQALGVSTAVFHVGLVAFVLLYSPVSLATGVLMHVWSRHNEYQADAYAVENGDGDSLIAALKKLSLNHLSNLTPHPAYVFFHYSHPSLYQRILAMKSSGY